mmetsp:Transcript_108407/g.288527  ORF Transcript_108407/g.288527 Transcript_108407/m.288527 type:complete len:263 (-) Transcript_108407:183-971(-)
MVTTTHWRPNETSLSRETFNDIVAGRKSDVPAILQRMSTMSRSAMQIVGSRSGAHLALGGSLHHPRRTSIRLNNLKADGPGSGSLRLGTPTVEPRKVAYSPREHEQPMLRSVSMPTIRPSHSVRCGYMPPEKGRIYSPLSSRRMESVTRTGLSGAVSDKVEALYNMMDLDGNRNLTREEASKFFRRFPEISTHAMFDEVDMDKDGLITAEEFRRFWEQVICNGYAEEDLLSELDDLISGNSWVNYADDRDVAVTPRSAALMR